MPQLAELTKLAAEARDNVKFLTTLERHFKNIASGPLSGILDTLPPMMNALRMVGEPRARSAPYGRAMSPVWLQRSLRATACGRCRGRRGNFLGRTLPLVHAHVSAFARAADPSFVVCVRGLLLAVRAP